MSHHESNPEDGKALDRELNGKECYGCCRRGLLAIRGIFGFGAIGCYFWAIQLLPIQDAMVLTFLAPLWVALLGPIFIKETPSK